MLDLSFIYETIGRILPFDCFAPNFMRQALFGLLLLAPVTAVMGTQVVNLRMAFFADAISHSVFAGAALGLILAIDPHLSTAFLAVIIGLGVTACRRNGKLSADSVIGVFFSAVVAFGLAAASRDRNVARNAQSFLYGDILTLGEKETAILFCLMLAVVVFQFFSYNRIVYMGLDPALAKTHGIRTAFFQYAFAGLLALTAVFSVWTVGVFLVTALLVLPAAAARNMSRSIGGMFWWALLITVFSSVTGLAISAQSWAATATGPTIILVAFACFVFSMAFSRIRGYSYLTAR